MNESLPTDEFPARPTSPLEAPLLDAPPVVKDRRTSNRLVRSWAWLLILAVGVGLFFVEERILVHTENPNFVPSVILIGAVTVPAAVVAFVSGRRFAYDVPVGIVSIVALLGGVIGTVIAGLLEYATIHKFGPAQMVPIGVIEESTKLLIPLAVLLFLPYRRPIDGLLIGVAAGAGFAVLETMGYAFTTLMASKGSISATEDVLFQRGLLSPAGHMAWTGLAALTLWQAAKQGWRPRAVLQFALAFIAVVVLHALWDGLGSVAAYAVLAVVSIGLLTWMTRRVLVVRPAIAAEPAAS